MIITANLAKQFFPTYSNKDTKLAREVAEGKLTKIINGLYETNQNTPGYLLAISLYGPSYISFEYALSFYGLIPERVTIITSASFNKKKKKQFITPFGTFSYKDVPIPAYSEEIILKEENNYTYHIASPEKALCDKLYTLKPLNNYQELERMLFLDLRIDPDGFKALNPEKITKLSKLYHSKNIKLLSKYMRRKKHE